jgi:hypothetical protein
MDALPIREHPGAASLDQVEVRLRGGPAELPRRISVAAAAIPDKIKIPYCGGYEHFERLPDAEAGNQPIVYGWSGRTRVAE